MGTEACGARRKKCQETGGDRGGEKVGDPAASVVGERRGVRTTAQQQESHGRSSLTSLCANSRAQPPSPGDCGQVLAQLPRKKRRKTLLTRTGLLMEGLTAFNECPITPFLANFRINKGARKWVRTPRWPAL